MADSAPKTVFIQKKRVFQPKKRPEMPYIVSGKKKPK